MFGSVRNQYETLTALRGPTLETVSAFAIVVLNWVSSTPLHVVSLVEEVVGAHCDELVLMPFVELTPLLTVCDMARDFSPGALHRQLLISMISVSLELSPDEWIV